ncbi:MAG: phosphate signaling complex protein PhoU [Anaerolineae bacterium]|nr:phosphate signaling complex protein PhoU [Anaerolineales bacterium]MCQ3974088.1 phosphate transport system regulatory protein PhoU [Anaerolineae bacterium]
MTTRVAFNQALNELRDDVLRMGSMVDDAINNAVRALKESDLALAGQIIAEDEKINELRFEVEERTVKLIARQQPVAGDLRTIIAAMNIALDLERMGDHAKGIAVIVQRMGGEPPVKPLIDIPRMAVISREMLRQSLDAFVAGDTDQAQAVAQRDDEVDHLYTEIFQELIGIIAADTSLITRAMFLLFAAHNLERIADRVTNICERVIFLRTGRLNEFPSESPNI